jgi:hypothetical protein
MLEDNEVLTDEEKATISEEVLGRSFNWNRSYGTSDRYPCYMHTLSARNDRDEEIPVSAWNPFFKNIINRFVEKHDIAPNGYKVLRAALNDQIHYSDPHGDIHIDYDTPSNYLIIIYLTDSEKGGTNIYDYTVDDIRPPTNSLCLYNNFLEDGKVWELPLKKHVKCEKFKVSMFNGKYWHAACPRSEKERRTICVFSITTGEK